MKVKETIGLLALVFAGLGVNPAQALEQKDLAGIFHLFGTYHVLGKGVTDTFDGHVIIDSDGNILDCEGSSGLIDSSWLLIHRQGTDLTGTTCDENRSNPAWWEASGKVNAKAGNKFDGTLTIKRGINPRQAVTYNLKRGTVSAIGDAEVVIDGVHDISENRIVGTLRVVRRPPQPAPVPLPHPVVTLWDEWTVWQDTGSDRYAVLALSGSEYEVVTATEASCNGQTCNLYRVTELRQVCNISPTGLIYNCRVRR